MVKDARIAVWRKGQLCDGYEDCLLLKKINKIQFETQGIKQTLSGYIKHPSYLLTAKHPENKWNIRIVYIC